MTISIRGIFAATLLAGSALVAAPAFADEAPAGPITISGNASLVSDYRFRGLSQSAGEVAIQGGITATHDSGFYVGTWASSIVVGSEVDVFAGWSGEVTSGITLDGGLLWYAYPTLDDLPGKQNYFEPYASISGAVGPATIKVGAAYAWDQQALGGDDNLYLFSNVDFSIPNTPVTVSGHVGYVDGVQANSFLSGESDKSDWDWSIGATASIYGPLSIGVSYIGTSGPSTKDFSDDTVVATLTASF